MSAGKQPMISRRTLRFLRSELMLIFGRRRNWAGLAVLASVPVVMGIAVRIFGSGTAPGGGPAFLDDVAGNGLFLALAALIAELPLFLPIAVAAIAADAIAAEAGTGTLRYLLAVPVTRTRLLAVKYTALVIFTTAAVLLVALTGVLLGLVLFGAGDFTLLSGRQVGFGEGAVRVLAVCGYLAAALAALAAVGLFVSTLTEQAVGATIAVVILALVSMVLDQIPQLDFLHPYLLTHWWGAFVDLLRDPVPLDGIRAGLQSAGAYVLIFVTAAWARLSNRDITA